MITEVPPRLVITGIVPPMMVCAAKPEPYICTMVPGAMGTPGSAPGANAFNMPLWFRTGATLGATAPEICVVAAVNPGAVAVAVTTTCGPVVRGVHVPAYNPDAELATLSASGGSPFENAATT